MIKKRTLKKANILMERLQKHRMFLLCAVCLFVLFAMLFNGSPEQEHESLSKVKQEAIANLEIDELTKQERVVNYLVTYRALPEYYIRKKEAEKEGWIAKKGNLCNVLPNKAIGGDRFYDREKKLPRADGRIWYEADINYQCGRRGAERLVYSNDGYIYVSPDHYKSFQSVRIPK